MSPQPSNTISSNIELQTYLAEIQNQQAPEELIFTGNVSFAAVEVSPPVLQQDILQNHKRVTFRNMHLSKETIANLQQAFPIGNTNRPSCYYLTRQCFVIAHVLLAKRLKSEEPVGYRGLRESGQVIVMSRAPSNL